MIHFIIPESPINIVTVTTDIETGKSVKGQRRAYEAVWFKHFVSLPIAPSGPQWHSLPQTPLAMAGSFPIGAPFALDFTPPPSSQGTR